MNKDTTIRFLPVNEDTMIRFLPEVLELQPVTTHNEQKKHDANCPLCDTVGPNFKLNPDLDSPFVTLPGQDVDDNPIHVRLNRSMYDRLLEQVKSTQSLKFDVTYVDDHEEHHLLVCGESEDEVSDWVEKEYNCHVTKCIKHAKPSTNNMKLYSVALRHGDAVQVIRIAGTSIEDVKAQVDIEYEGFHLISCEVVA